MNRLRLGLAAALAVACFGADAAESFWTPEARQRLLEGLGSPTERLAVQRLQWAQQAEEALARGDTAGAKSRLDDLTLQLHSPDVELALVRADMQAGEYRRALAFAAHAAGAHEDVTSGTALYAWLLHLGGQSGVASRILAHALQVAPGDEVLTETRSALALPSPKPGPLLMSPPRRFAPYGFDLLPDSASAVATGTVSTATLAADGLHAFVPLSALNGARRIWVRNGLGQTVTAEWDRSAAHPLMAVLRLGAALPLTRGTGRVSVAPFAGGPAHMVEYANGPGASPAWPLLRSGFFGRNLLAPGDRLLGIEAPTGVRGGPVFDNAGRLAGVAIAGADQRDHLISILDLDALLPSAPEADAAGAKPAITQPMDAIYEGALRTALQVLIAR